MYKLVSNQELLTGPIEYNKQQKVYEIQQQIGVLYRELEKVQGGN